MKQFKSRLFQQFRWQVFVLFAITAAAIVSYQNCGKNVATGLSSGSGGGVNSALKAAPFPVEVSINQISYMSCPMSGANVQQADPLANPYYRVRFGAFDNSSNNNFVYYTDGDHVGGIGLTKDAMNYLRRSSSYPNATAVSNFLSGSPYTNNSYPVATFIYKDRSSDALAWAALGTTFLDNISESSLKSDLAGAVQVQGQGTRKQSFFPEMPITKRSLVGSINYGKTIEEEKAFRDSLANQYLFFGFTNANYVISPEFMIQHLSSPDDNVTKRLNGSAFSLSFYPSQPILTGVNEYRLDNSSYGSPTDLTNQENQTWNCFYMDIVRDIDRKYWTINGSATVYGISFTAGDAILPTDIKNTQYGALTEHYFQNTTEATNVYSAIVTKYAGAATVPAGIFSVCPSEDPTAMTAAQKDTLKIIRRFLPADQWDVNMSKGCVVPKDKAISSGAKCYQSGDNEVSSYVIYNGSTCGPNSNTGECSSKVSFCWRRH